MFFFLALFADFASFFFLGCCCLSFDIFYIFDGSSSFYSYFFLFNSLKNLCNRFCVWRDAFISYFIDAVFFSKETFSLHSSYFSFFIPLKRPQIHNFFFLLFLLILENEKFEIHNFPFECVSIYSKPKPKIEAQSCFFCSCSIFITQNNIIFFHFNRIASVSHAKNVSPS